MKNDDAEGYIVLLAMVFVAVVVLGQMFFRP